LTFLRTDPHPGVYLHIHSHFNSDDLSLGNLLIRAAPQMSRSPYNFEIVLLDHGLYFDLDTQLRINYSKLWLSLIATNSPSVNADRRKYAALVGNIGPDLVGQLVSGPLPRGTDTFLVSCLRSCYYR
jgi:aarF domain-containing kinase